MQKPDIPQTETTRLEALRALKILDTPPEERFDSLTRIAKRTFDVPTVMVSLVDENRQWYKSSIGTDVCETAREISFCGHAILSDELFIVPDTLEDERFANNPMVVGEPGVRFYAGYPIKAINGERIGSFCIIDYKPRDLSNADIEVLKDLGSMAERELSMVHLATKDELTKISNRRGFMSLAEHSFNLSIRHHFTSSLVYFDLDKFKFINDKYGHNEGDKALVVFANKMKDAFRSSDIIARVGGDEFVVLLGNTNEKQAEDLVKSFKGSIDEYNNNAGNEYEISFSHGTTEYDLRKHSTIKDMMIESDTLMYKSKKNKQKINKQNVNSDAEVNYREFCVA